MHMSVYSGMPFLQNDCITQAMQLVYPKDAYTLDAHKRGCTDENIQNKFPPILMKLGDLVGMHLLRYM